MQARARRRRSRGTRVRAGATAAGSRAGRAVRAPARRVRRGDARLAARGRHVELAVIPGAIAGLLRDPRSVRAQGTPAGEAHAAPVGLRGPLAGSGGGTDDTPRGLHTLGEV